MLNIKNASTSEFGNNCTPVVGLLEEWQKGKKRFKGSEKNLGGTMRLGLYDAILKNNSLISKIYSEKKIKERHRHRYEVNIKYKDDFEKKGLIFSALSSMTTAGIYGYKSFYYDPKNEWKLISDVKNHVYIVKNRGEDICHYSSVEITNNGTGNTGITGKWLKTKCDNN